MCNPRLVRFSRSSNDASAPTATAISTTQIQRTMSVPLPIGLASPVRVATGLPWMVN